MYCFLNEVPLQNNKIHGLILLCSNWWHYQRIVVSQKRSWLVLQSCMNSYWIFPQLSRLLAFPTNFQPFSQSLLQFLKYGLYFNKIYYIISYMKILNTIFNCIMLCNPCRTDSEILLQCNKNLQLLLICNSLANL